MCRVQPVQLSLLLRSTVCPLLTAFPGGNDYFNSGSRRFYSVKSVHIIYRNMTLLLGCWVLEAPATCLKHLSRFFSDKVPSDALRTMLIFITETKQKQGTKTETMGMFHSERSLALNCEANVSGRARERYGKCCH